MARPIDPTVLGAIEPLLPVEGAPPSSVPGLRLGDDGSDMVGHLVFARHPDSDAPKREMEIFVSRQATALMRLAAERRAAFEGGADTLTDAKLFVYAELAPSRRADRDTLSGLAFEAVANPAFEPKDVVGALNAVLRHARALPMRLGYDAPTFETRIATGVGPSSSGLLEVFADKMLEALAIASEFLGEKAAAIADFLRQSSRMPPELWNPEFRLKDWASFLAKFAAGFDARLAAIQRGLSDRV